MWSRRTGTALLLSLFLSSTSDAACPLVAQNGAPTSQQRLLNPHTPQGRRQLRLLKSRRSLATRDGGIPDGGFAAVRESIKGMLTDSKEFFPADFESPIGPHYGGLMIRLAWHCSGSYRASDGRGGCDGGRIRFDPELTWMDNANLKFALQLLDPVKEKFGSDLSWGDLIVLAGNTAIESMGGPVLGFCGGRMDDADGSDSLILGPSDIQEELTPCQSIGMQGQCEHPLGPTTVGLIYVNPAGPVTAPGDPVASGIDIRNAFARMGFTDNETVALIGGGHAFGKAHGACTTPPCGEAPMVGIGSNTFTSGFEGAWTTAPTTWTNQYFTNLFNLDWEIHTGPGGNLQWFPNGTDLPIMMLTSDIALAADPDYEPIAREFESDIQSLEKHFAYAWYHLTTGDMGPTERCINENPDDVPPAQDWQKPLPMATTKMAVDYVSIRERIQDLIDTDVGSITAFTNLAYRCASTFRATDYIGGCNGARIRFPPESDWETNAGTSEALSVLEAVKAEYPEISYADLIVLAGQTAVEAGGVHPMKFCGGRVDATDADGSDVLAPRFYSPAVVSIRDDMQVKGLTAQEGVALFAAPYIGSGSSASVSRATALSPTDTNQFFIDLLAGDGLFNEYELALLEDEFIPIVTEYAEDEAMFKKQFSAAWTKMMNADRYDGPDGNICSGSAGEVEMSDMSANGEEELDEDESRREDGDEDAEDAETTSNVSVSFSVFGIHMVLWLAAALAQWS